MSPKLPLGLEHETSGLLACGHQKVCTALNLTKGAKHEHTHFLQHRRLQVHSTLSS